MASKTLQEIAASVQRRVGLSVPMGIIIEAIGQANRELHTTYEWPWTYAEYLFPIKAPYSEGTINVANGSPIVGLSGGTWDATWAYKRIYLGANSVSYRVDSFTSNSAILHNPINIAEDLVDEPYTVFQDLYPLPSDCDPGDIVLIVNSKMRYRLKYMPTYTFTWQNIWPGTFMSNFQYGFADYGYDDATFSNLIMFAPPVGAATEFLMVYRRKPPDFSFVTQRSLIPDSYDRALELLASYMVKTSIASPIAGWMEDKTEAYQILQKMRRRMVNPLRDIYSGYMTWPYMPHSRNTVYSDGLFLSGPTAAS